MSKEKSEKFKRKKNKESNSEETTTNQPTNQINNAKHSTGTENVSMESNKKRDNITWSKKLGYDLHWDKVKLLKDELKEKGLTSKDVPMTPQPHHFEPVVAKHNWTYTPRYALEEKDQEAYKKRC
jgi:hypothetical protein